MRTLSGGWLGFVGLAVAASNCGGISTSAGDASVDGSAGDGGSSGSGGGSGSGSSGSGSGGSSGSSGGSSSGSGSGSSGSSGGSSGCDAACGGGRVCCLGQCVSTTNDPNNCGGCGIKCGPGTYCNLGPPNPGNGGQSPSCQTIPCPGGSACASNACCGTSCCTPGQLCCQSQGGPVAQYPSCYTPTAAQPTCPPGCPLCVSDRNLKRDIEPVDDQAVLESVARMPISTWSYKSDDPSVRHLGPMAQDFHAAFGLGDTDRAYYAIDAHGVAFAAIRALSEQVKEQNARIERMEQENRELRERVTCGP